MWLSPLKNFWIRRRKNIFVGKGVETKKVIVGHNVKLYGYSNLYGCTIGHNTTIGPFTEIQSDVKIGPNCKISSHSFICSGVAIAQNTFVGHGVIFINDRKPYATSNNGNLKNKADWKLEETFVEDSVSIGSGAIIMCGVRIGSGAQIGAGAVVTKNISAGAVVVGIPARTLIR